MVRSWVVDCNNVVGSRPDGWWHDRRGAAARLVDEIVRWRDAVGEHVVVVIDGHPDDRLPEGEMYGVEVRYAHARRRDAADDEIVRIVEGRAERENLRVVTSDRRLRERVGALGAATEGARRFLTRISDIEVRRSDRSVLAHFGIDESALLGRGGEARVFAIDSDRVLRLPHRHGGADLADQRRELLDAIAGSGELAVPQVLEHRQVEERTVIIERRLPGRNAMEVLAERGIDRAGLIRGHLDVATRIARLPCPATTFGELWGEGKIQAASFAGWALARVGESLRVAPADFGHLDPARLTDDVIAALPTPEPGTPKLVHLDAFLGNMLAERGRITAVIDFGPMTIGGPPHLDALAAIAYLAPEITPTATAGDRAVARSWARDHGLSDAVEPVERWMAAYWAAASGDHPLQRWCRRILLSP